MKAKTLAKIAGISLPIASLVSGCMTDTGFSVDFLKVKAGHQSAIGTPDEAATSTAQVMFEKDTEPYDKSEISNGAVESTAPIWKHYQNRQQNSQ